MKILITSLRAPVAIEWVRIAQKSGHSVTAVDTLKCPLGKNMPGINYVKISSPRFAFASYRDQMLALIAEHDFVIPTCEDVFYLSKVVSESVLKHKVFAPDKELLFRLHNKLTVHECLNMHVVSPQTKLIEHVSQIDSKNKHTILKPVFSRFGTNVITEIHEKNITKLDITPTNPWVQQEFVKGTYLCSYAILQKGVVVCHIVYEPKYLVNNAASTYFRAITNQNCDRFIEQFAKDHAYNGQIAFDFIQNEKGLYVIECNPRATSGLHLVAPSLQVTSEGIIATSKSTLPKNCRVGKSIYFMFGLRYLFAGRISELVGDYKNSRNVIAGISMWSQVCAFFEMLYIQCRNTIKFSEATAFDIEYNGENET